MAEEFVPRPYQAELEEIAYSKNTIIHLPTGSGKTFIAIRLINRFSEGFKKPWGQGGKRTFFLVNTVPLVEQHKNNIQKLSVTDRVVGYSGENGVDYWNRTKWTSELEEYYVIVLTSAILADMLTHRYVTLEDINLLIFDECHHAIIDHPMRLVMKHFESCPVEKQPRVLGLTAPLLNSNVKIRSIDDKLKDLETTFHATIATADLPENLLQYSANPQEEIVFYDMAKRNPIADGAISELANLILIIKRFKLPDLKEIQDKGEGEEDFNPKRTLQDVSTIVQASIEFIDTYGIFGGSLGILAYLIILQRLKFAARSIEEELLYTTVFTHMSMARMRLEDIMSDQTGFRKIVKYSSPQILEFLTILKRYDNGTKETTKLSCIVFVEKRLTSKILFNILKEVIKANPVQFGFIKHDYIVGAQVNPFKNTREDYYKRKACEKALLKFRNNELNLLIATSVIEEGVDIPQCDFVLKFDAPQHYRSYIQSKGRARCPTSKYIIMVGESERKKFIDKYGGLKETEKYLEKLLWGDSAKRTEPSKNEIQTNLYDEDIIPPFVSKEGLTLRAISAMSLINRYCSLLARDQYTVITPNLTQKKVTKIIRGFPIEHTQVLIYMPIGCPIKDPIKGDPMTNLKAAKCSAALKTCVKLYELGELGADLLPKSRWEVDFETLGLKSNFESVWNADNELKGPKPGTKKRIRTHPIVFPPCLNDNGKGEYYLHIMHTTPSFDCPSKSKYSELYKLFLNNQSFGLLTPNKIPNLCDFPMFLPVGEINVSVEVNYTRLIIDEREFDVVKRFHYYVFDQVLGIANKLLSFEGKQNCMYVVATDKYLDNHIVDFQLMVDFESKTMAPVATPSDSERKNLLFKADDYKCHVVTPWYRDEYKNMGYPERYIVTEVFKTNPYSPMPSKNITYDKYYREKYGLQVLCEKQFMLEVVNISSRLNCLLPRSEKTNEKFDEHFVPEFCIKYDFPAVLWYKATMLPSILHRIFMLLIANDLRTEILTGLECETLHPPSGNWKPIVVDKHAAAKSIEPKAKQQTNNTDLKKFKPLTEQLFELNRKELKKKYPWDESTEPIDIERNICDVTLQDIERYDQFVRMSMNGSHGGIGLNINRNKVQLTTKTVLNHKFPNKINLFNCNGEKYPELRDILTAITTIKSDDCFNNERYETLGDAYLKFKVTLDLITLLPDCKEGELTSMKGKIIGNRNLYYAGNKINLPGRIKIEKFSPRKLFLIPGFFLHKQLMDEGYGTCPETYVQTNITPEEILSGKLSNFLYQSRESFGPMNSEETTGMWRYHSCFEKIQDVSDKTVADCVEALIGLFLDKGGLSVASELLKWLEIMPKPTNLNQREAVFKNVEVSDHEIDRLLNHNTERIEEILGYTFKKKSLILEALSHPSYIRNRVTKSYERLEFLGDAILDFLITKYIYDNCGDLSPGELTDLRSALVNNVTFASYVVKLDLYRFICYQINPALEKAILTFVDHQVKRGHEIVEQVIYLIEEDECRIAQYVEVPKVLSDVFESLIGAIYTDCSDLDKVWSVVFNIMQKEIIDFSKNIPIQPVRVLQETTDACPEFGSSKTPNSNEPVVMMPVTFTKNGEIQTVYGFGSNKFGAKRAAAKLALKVLNM